MSEPSIPRAQHPRGIFGQVRTLLLQPRQFFRTLPQSESQNWLIAAIIVLALLGASAIQQQAANGGANTSAFAGDSAAPTWIPALTVGSEMIINWAVMTFFLCIVSLSRGIRPRFDHNFKIAVWSSFPMGLLGGLQLLYMNAGGRIGKPGLTGVVAMLPSYSLWSSLSQSLALSFAARLTIFWLWSLLLFYFGARYTLKGSRVVVVLVLTIWIAYILFVPLAINSLTSSPLNTVPTVMPIPTDTQP